MMFRLLLVGFTCLVLLSYCSQKNQRDPKASSIVEACIKAHGGKAYDVMDMSFTFRQFRVRLQHQNGKFKYERTTTDSLKNVVRDILTNNGFSREVNGKKQTLSQTDSDKYREGLNAIAYFLLLPHKLSEPAVNWQYLGTGTIGNQAYDKIRVYFSNNGGGTHHEDEFCFWINQKGATMDYFSYAAGGPRFRKATKRTRVGGMIFQDYENYEVLDSTLAMHQYDTTFMAGKVQLLSIIEQGDYRVNSAKSE